jgi:hypothetical protein
METDNGISLLNLNLLGVQIWHTKMLNSKGTSHLRAPFLSPTKGGMIPISLFSRIPNQFENMINSLAITISVSSCIENI